MTETNSALAKLAADFQREIDEMFEKHFPDLCEPTSCQIQMAADNRSMRRKAMLLFAEDFHRAEMRRTGLHR